jgi:hypothetical protein
MEFKNFQKNRTTTECKGTRALLLLLPPTTGVWNDMVCVISSPSIVTPLLLFLLIREKKLVRTFIIHRHKNKSKGEGGVGTIQKKKKIRSVKTHKTYSREVGNGVEFMATMNVISRARCLFLFFFLRLCVCVCVFEERCVSRSAI